PEHGAEVGAKIRETPHALLPPLPGPDEEVIGLPENSHVQVEGMDTMLTEDSAYALSIGSSQGVGGALALELAGRGYGVLLVARSEEPLRQVAADAGALNGGRAEVLVMDLCAHGAADRVAAWAISQELPITCLVNNAGQGLWGKFEALQ